VLIQAPPGYGKTTLLAQWAGLLPAVAHLRLDETHNDPLVLVADLYDAVSTVVTLDSGLRDALRSPAELTGFGVPARFTEALGRSARPFVLMLDDAHKVVGQAANDWLGWILTRLPPGVRVVMASRGEPSIPLGPAIAAGALLRLRHADLRLEPGEARRLAAQEGIELSSDALEEVLARTDGWPVAMHLVLLSLRAGSELASAATHETGLVPYLRSELLEPLDPVARGWVLRTAVLDEMTGLLCDAALGTSGSLQRLRDLEARNVLLYPLDEARTAYRYHPLYRAFLLEELEAWSPGTREVVAARAAEWLESAGRIAEAVRVARRSSDPGLATSLVERHALSMFWRGGLATANEWLSWYDHDGVREQRASIAVLAALAEMVQGERGRAMRWLSAAERSTDARPMPDGTPDKGPWVATVRAYLMPLGIDAFVRDTRVALEGIPEGSFLGPASRILSVVRDLLEGDRERAERGAAEHARVHEGLGAVPGLLLLRGIQASLLLARGRLDEARDVAREGLAVSARNGLEDYVMTGLLAAVSGRIAAADGDRVAARSMLARVHRMRHIATDAVPWYSVLMRTEAIHAALQVQEVTLARTLLAEIDAIMRSRPDLGEIGRRAEALRAQVRELRVTGPSGWSLTPAELRVLTYLPSRLSFREIAGRLGVSTHTVKTQVMSSYSKLGVSSRSDAIRRAVELHLLDPAVLYQADALLPRS
jgi:LuxR family maltose regulon positive regulatory protein